MYYEKKGITNGVMAKVQGSGSSDEDEIRSDGPVADMNTGIGRAIQVRDALQIQQPQTSATVIHWERFLPTGSLKVLLVENDDSTRHIVNALLRNCSYEVTAVANGLHAWKILEDLNNHIDLVLTEVVVPILSGMGLLSKIMGHKTLNNLPVIMMSSHDSMGIVFKCLSKGAVDFLVKPIRKNELKNLWQHVWRRCHSSSGSGSGSESGTQTKKYVNLKTNDESENDTSSTNDQKNKSKAPSIPVGSDNGSGTQGSWTKRAVDSDSLQPISPSCPLTDAPDSTCAQVMRLSPETCGNLWMHATRTKENPETDDKRENDVMGHGLEIGASKEPNYGNEYRYDKSSQLASKRQNKSSEGESKPFDNGELELKHSEQAPKLISSIVNCISSSVEGKKVDLSNVSNARNKAPCVSAEVPFLELSLTRLGGSRDCETVMTDDRNVLRHSNVSAFSKYNTGSSSNQAPTGNVMSCSPLNNSSHDKFNKTSPDLNSVSPSQQSNRSIKNNEIDSTVEYVAPKPETVNEQNESTSALQSSALESVCLPEETTFVKSNSEDVTVDAVQAQDKGSFQQVQVQHHHHHHHHHYDHYYHVHRTKKHHLHPDKDDSSLKNVEETDPQYGSSIAFGGPVKGNAGNNSIDGSASGSNHGSVVQNGNSSLVNAGPTNMESDNGAAGNSRTGFINGSANGIGADDNRIAQRKAALTKFRQKRKDRCFEKKVRYQSRKKLAEQRPRVRGQFVRQIMSENKMVSDSPSNGLTSGDNTNTSESAR